METNNTHLSTSLPYDLQNETKAPTSVPPAERCFIEPQQAFIIIATVGSLMLALIISVMVLAYKVIGLKRRCQARRPTHSKMDVRGSGHWSNEQAEGGIVGPCETNVLLEEVRTEADDAVEQDEEEEAMLHQSNTKNIDEENVMTTIQSSTSRDSCIDPAKELENMPLVV